MKDISPFTNSNNLGANQDDHNEVTFMLPQLWTAAVTAVSQTVL